MTPDWADDAPRTYRGYQYAQQVVSGEILACTYVQLACQRHLDDLEDAESEYTFDLASGERVCRFIEMLPHVKGQWARKRELIHLEPWQCFFLSVAFGWKRANGTRRFREIYLEVPRKNAKSTIAAGIGLYMLAADGEAAAEVYSGASSKKQAWEIFGPARLMAKRTADYLEAFGCEVHAESLAIPGDGSRFEPLIGQPGDGSSPTCALVDEYHEHRTSELFDTMLTGMGAREAPLQVVTTTAGINRAGPCYDKRGQVIRVLEKVIQNDELFGIIYTLDKDDDWTDPALLKKSNPNYNVSASAEFLEARLRDATSTASRQNIFRTKHHNLWVGAHVAWMDMVAWEACPERKSLEDLAERECYIGLDLASKIDVAAMVAVFPPVEDDPLWHVHGRYFVPEDTVEEHKSDTHAHYYAWARQDLVTLTEGNIIDLDLIEDDIREFCEKHSVRAVGYDPMQATQLATHLLSERVPMVEVNQQVRQLSEPMKQTEALVLDGKLAHGGCPVMTWMMSNVVAKLDAKDNIYPRKENLESKIDGPVALIMAISRILAGEDKRRQSVYDRENRGFRTL